MSRGGNRVVVMLEGSERAVMPKQPTAIRKNACWAPPVVAIAGYYKFDTLPDAPRSKPERVSKSCRKWPEGTGQGGATITVESVLSLRPGDHPEVTCEVLEDITGHYLPGPLANGLNPSIPTCLHWIHAVASSVRLQRSVDFNGSSNENGWAHTAHLSGQRRSELH